MAVTVSDVYSKSIWVDLKVHFNPAPNHSLSVRPSKSGVVLAGIRVGLGSGVGSAFGDSVRYLCGWFLWGDALNDGGGCCADCFHVT